MQTFIKVILILIILGSVSSLVSHLAAQNYVVTSPGMEPGLQVGERLLISKMAYHFEAPDRGEIVYFRSPNGDTPQLKRIIGLPGDVIEINNKSVYVNGIKLSEPYVKYRPNYTLLSYQVPPDHYFILEDNRNIAHESSTDWTIPRDSVIGRAWIHTWPPEKWGAVNNYSLEPQLVASDAHQ